MRIDIEEIWRAAAATVFEAGPLPEHIEDAPIRRIGTG